MNTSFLLPSTIIIQVVLIYLFSRQAISELFHIFRIFFHNDSVVYAFVSLFFLPGTIIHELGHFFAATVLLLRVYNVHIFPQWEKNQIKLGSVLYEKKDVFRGILVGVAPLFFAFFFFWLLSAFKLFPNENFWLNILLGYIVFTVSSTMFSSKKDLVDFAFIIPLIIIIIGTIYVFDINIDFIFANQLLIGGIADFFKQINFYLFFSLIVNIVLILLFKSFRFLFKR